MEGEPHTELRHRVTSDCCRVKLTVHCSSRVRPQNLLKGKVLLESELFSSQMAALMWRVTPLRPSSPLKIIISAGGGTVEDLWGRRTAEWMLTCFEAWDCRLMWGIVPAAVCRRRPERPCKYNNVVWTKTQFPYRRGRSPICIINKTHSLRVLSLGAFPPSPPAHEIFTDSFRLCSVWFWVIRQRYLFLWITVCLFDFWSIKYSASNKGLQIQKIPLRVLELFSLLNVPLNSWKPVFTRTDPLAGQVVPKYFSSLLFKDLYFYLLWAQGWVDHG